MNIVIGIILMLIGIVYSIYSIKTRIKSNSFFDKYINFKGLVFGLLLEIAGLLFITEKVEISELFNF